MYSKILYSFVHTHFNYEFIPFQLLGLGILAIGVWAWTEKDTFNNLSLLTNIALDPAFIFIWAGAITFLIGFTGCVGALRENTALLAAYAIFLAILLLLEMTAGILGFIFKDWIKEQATSGFQAFIVHYRDDPDQQNLIDWIQEGWLQCCGIESPNDWDKNVYFNCSSASVGSREACGVPFSCCKPAGELIKNVQCGYDVRSPDYRGDLSSIIKPRRKFTPLSVITHQMLQRLEPRKKSLVKKNFSVKSHHAYLFLLCTEKNRQPFDLCVHY